MKRLIAIVGIALLAAGCAGNRNRTDAALIVPPAPEQTTLPPLIPGEDVVPPPRESTRRPPPASTRNLAAAAVAPPRAVARWTSYKQFQFDGDSATLQASETSKISDIAGYAARNPSIKLGIDGTDTRDGDLASKRVAAVRSALIAAGVPASRIQAGAFGTSRIKRNRRVDVLLNQ
jgi:outer membrane protein OmpA-like peptidoglycan-associated protein